MLEPDRPRRRRVMAHDTRDARMAITDVVSRFAAWHDTLTIMAAKNGRRQSDAEQQEMLDQCFEIRRQVAEARTDLIIKLAGAPARVSGHSRVVDVERALDRIEAALDDMAGRSVP